MQRYFVGKEQFSDKQVIITGDDVYHLSRVLRAKAGEKIICSNGDGLDLLTEIAAVEPQRIICNIISEIKETREPKTKITLVQALPKADKMDLIIQKGTEIGVSLFFPFISERTVIKLDEKKEQKRLERWRKIAKEAAEQSHRSKIPEIMPIVKFNDLIQYITGKTSLTAYEQENNLTLFQVLNNYSDLKELILVIGPEGGFTEQEISKLKSNGSLSVSLGKRILRTETAGLVGAANILYHLEQGN